MQLAVFTSVLTWDKLPETVRQNAVMRVLDLVSAAAGAHGNGLIDNMKQAFAEMGAENSRDGVPIFGEPDGKKWNLMAAAEINAMLAHTLEMDDVHPASKSHASACLIPAAWALARQLQRSGKELLTAVVAGYETAFRVGMAFGVAPHRERGWHATATSGIFGTAAACAHLLNLDAKHTAWALGLAGSQAAGTWGFLGDGTNSKVLNPGHAAARGLESAFLAQYGMTGPVHILEAEDGGLLRAMSDGGRLEKLTEGLGECWEILNMDMKPYPCCRSAHAGIDGALSLRKAILGEGMLTLADAEQRILDSVVSLEAETYKIGYQQCAVSDGCLRPQTPLDAKFSLPFTLAGALLLGQVDQSLFTPEKVADPAIQTMLGRIRVREAADLTAAYPGHWSCRVKVQLKDGRVLEQFIQDPTGSYRKPLSEEAALQKAEGLLANVYPHQAAQVARKLLNLPEAEKLPEV